MVGGSSLRSKLKATTSRALLFIPTLVFASGLVTMAEAQLVSHASDDQDTLQGCARFWPTQPGSPVPVERWRCDDVVSVSGTQMTLNGQRWLSRGVVLQALVAPLPVLQAIEPEVVTGKENYGAAELNAIRAFGADTIRFQVSQPALDPANALFNAQYVNEVFNGLALARQNGFIVVIMMQDETISGETTPHPFATAETLRDWQMLNAVFAKDQGVLYELYNEPKPAATDANWAIWKNGGSTGAGADPSVGMQTIASQLREEGSENVFVLDGLDYAATLQNVPLVYDSLGRVVYAVHPYPHGSADESQWPTQFGNESATIPVYADEWSAQSGTLPSEKTPLGLGGLPTYQIAVDLLNYLRVHHIPLRAGAFDVPNFMVQDVPGWTLTNYDNYSTSIRTDDAGLLVHSLYESRYLVPLTDEDGVTH